MVDANLLFSESLQGKLLYCHPPPHINPKDFQPQHAKFAKQIAEAEQIADKPSKVKRIENTVDKSFFHQVRFSPWRDLFCDNVHYTDT